ncbi:MAG: hypothetical protein ACI837_000895 [Crocinitomicaceae bacterium]|jgi:hypothetical protein
MIVSFVQKYHIDIRVRISFLNSLQFEWLKTFERGDSTPSLKLSPAAEASGEGLGEGAWIVGEYDFTTS